jgi:hypothetical protein
MAEKAEGGDFSQDLLVGGFFTPLEFNLLNCDGIISDEKRLETMWEHSTCIDPAVHLMSRLHHRTIRAASLQSRGVIWANYTDTGWSHK